jgi:hypothetical protein
MRLTISPAVRKRLKEARVARLATTNRKGQPHVVPICYVFDGALFYTAIDRKPKRVRAERLTRVRNITTTGQAALLIDEYSEDCLGGWMKCSAKIYFDNCLCPLSSDQGRRDGDATVAPASCRQSRSLRFKASAMHSCFTPTATYILPRYVYAGGMRSEFF